MLVADSLFLTAAFTTLVEAMDLSHGMLWSAVGIGLTLFAVSMLALVVGLLAFHLYLVATGSTTWELVKGTAISYLRGNEGRFNLGLRCNIGTFFNPPAEWDTIGANGTGFSGV